MSRAQEKVSAANVLPIIEIANRFQHAFFLMILKKLMTVPLKILSMSGDNIYDLIIIGAGPAGLSAGLYAGRFRLNTLILEKMSAGGQIMLSSTIENYPGFPAGISTTELIDKFKKQVEEVGVKIEYSEVLEISEKSSSNRNFRELKAELPQIYTVRTSGGSFDARSLIIATGAQAKSLGVEGEERFIGRGVSYCATCDGPLFKNKDVIVVGGGDRAIEEAQFLSSYAAKVTVIHRRQELRASKILEERARQNSKINFILGSVIERIIGSNKVGEVIIKNVKTGRESAISCQGVFIFVGIIPNTQFLKNLLDIDEFGFIITDENLASSKKGIFAGGDCRKKSLYQVITACAEGATAANSAYKYLTSKI